MSENFFSKLFRGPRSSKQRIDPRQKDSRLGHDKPTVQQAEQTGSRVFPDDPRGAELRKKEALGLINDEEKEALRRLHQLKARRENTSPTVQRLWERTEENDPNICQVGMGDGKSVEVVPTDETEKVIWTFALGGCNTSVVLTENEDGTRDCMLTHYPPTELSVNMSRLGDMIDASQKMKTAKIKKALLVLPGEWTQNPKTKKYEMKEKNPKAVDLLTLTIQAKLGTDVEIMRVPYSGDRNLGEKDQGILAVHVPPFGKGDVHYQTENTYGKLTEEKIENR